MKHARRDIQTPDGITLRAESWTPEEIRCVVVISHGQGEHVGRYAELAADLQSIGAWVLGADHRGQGESGGKPGHIESFGVYGQDLAHVMNVFAQELPESERGGVPWFVFGHSMGGLIALDGLISDILPQWLRGVVLSAPLLRLAAQPPALKVWLGNMAAVLAPGLALPAGLDASGLSRDEAVVKAYVEDARRVDVVTARWFQRMNESRQRVMAEIGAVTSPLYWYVGTGDPICDHQASVETFAKLAAPEDNDQTLQSFEGYLHELHNEPTQLREPVVDSIRDWIAARID